MGQDWVERRGVKNRIFGGEASFLSEFWGFWGVGGKLGSIGPSTSLRVEQSSSFGLELGLIGFVLGSVCCSLFVVLWHTPLFLLYLCLYCPF